MREPRDNAVDRFAAGAVRQLRTPHHHHRQSKGARRRDLAIGRSATAVLGQHEVSLEFFEQAALIGFAEWSSASHISAMRDRQWRIDRVHAAHEIMMLRRCAERRDLLAAERDEYPPRRAAEHVDRLGDIGNLDPAIADDPRPRRPAQRDESDAGRRDRLRGVRRHLGGIGMRRIDQDVDALARQIVCEPGRTAEAASSHGDGLRRWLPGTAGERQGQRQVGLRRQPLRQQARFRRAAENEDAHVAP
jgi:hypothetical protein